MLEKIAVAMKVGCFIGTVALGGVMLPFRVAGREHWG